jgi:hypothetical protein
VESAIPKIILTCQNEQQGIKMNGSQAIIPSELLTEECSCLLIKSPRAIENQLLRRKNQSGSAVGSNPPRRWQSKQRLRLLNARPLIFGNQGKARAKRLFAPHRCCRCTCFK